MIEDETLVIEILTLVYWQLGLGRVSSGSMISVLAARVRSG